MTKDTPSTPPETREQGFITFLESLNPEGSRNANRKAFAELRRSLSFKLGTHIPSFGYVEPMLRGIEGRNRDMYYLVAGLYAMHPKRTSTEFGTALAKLREHRDSDSLEPRFLALLAADEDDQLAHHLRQMVSLLKQSDIGLNYAALLKDLRAWQHVDKYVQRRWAQRYYRYTPPTASTFSPSDDAPQAPKGH